MLDDIPTFCNPLLEGDDPPGGEAAEIQVTPHSRLVLF